MGTASGQAGSSQPPQQALPQAPMHAAKRSMDELFEDRWRKAYAVRHLERESRQGKGQTVHPQSSGHNTIPAGRASKQAAVVDVQAAAGDSAAEALARLSLGSAAPHEAAAQEQDVCQPGQGNAQQAPHHALQQASQQAPQQAPQQQQKQLRQQEVVDEDDELGAGTSSSLSTASAAAQAPCSVPSGPPEDPGLQHDGQPAAAACGQQEEEDEQGEAECRLVWDSSSRRPGAASKPVPSSSTSQGCNAAVQLKEQGNARLRAGDLEAAVQCYTDALAACNQQAGAAQSGEAQAGAGADADRHLLATLYSNRAHVFLKLKQIEQAAADAQQAHQLHPTWPKPLHRLAQARLALGQWAAAVAACKAGEALSPRNCEGHTEFTPLLDRTAVHAARAGSLVGFDGQQLEVRSAGEDAWLGGPAPHVPELDGLLEEDGSAAPTALPLPSTSGIDGSSSTSGAMGQSLAGGTGTGTGGLDALAAWDYRKTAEVRQRRRTSFRSIREAVEAARDGDRILLRRGVHNGMGECITLSKRLLIEGEGSLGETVIDQRANVPTFRITRGGVVLRGIDLDQTGFREALLVDGAPAVPTFLRCVITGKKCGVKAFGSSAPRLEQCIVEKCGEQGVRAMESAAPLLHSCTIAECEEEAAVAMDTSKLTLQACILRGCKGPGVDLSGSATCAISGGTIEQCVGGVWLWDASQALLHGASVAGGPSHVILADGTVTVGIRDSTLKGSVHATDAAWQGILHDSNILMDPDQPTDFPPEEGPFRFVPNRFTRKQ